MFLSTVNHPSIHPSIHPQSSSHPSIHHQASIHLLSPLIQHCGHTWKLVSHWFQMEIITGQNIIFVGNGQIFAQAQLKTTSSTSNYRPVTQYCKRTRGVNESSTQRISKVECNQWPEQHGLMLEPTAETSNEAVSTSGCRFIHGCGRTNKQFRCELLALLWSPRRLWIPSSGSLPSRRSRLAHLRDANNK